jgi:hypothetical protein
MTALKPGREYEWRHGEKVVPMGKLIAVGPTGIHQWESGTLTTSDARFAEVKRPLFGGRK